MYLDTFNVKVHHMNFIVGNNRLQPVMNANCCILTRALGSGPENNLKFDWRTWLAFSEFYSSSVLR